MMRVLKIWNADIYRDGGSYGFCFDADDGNWYEFFVKTRALEKTPSNDFRPPVIYLEGCNSGKVVRELSWDEGASFIASLSYDSPRFRELTQIVRSNSK